jgi:mRNA-degrading endonuclease RelE of RelBE toxin-antitoxin system
MAQRETRLIFSPDAKRQLFQFRAFDQRRIVDAIRKQLIQADPRNETRNKFALDRSPDCADYELRIGRFRVFYRVAEEEESVEVIVALIGRKDRNKLIVEGEVFEL